MSINAQLKAARDLLQRARAERDDVEIELGKQQQNRMRATQAECNDDSLAVEIRSLAENLKSFKAPGDAIQIHKLQGELEAEKFHKDLLEAELNKSRNSLNSWKQLVQKFSDEKYILKEQVSRFKAEEKELQEAYAVVSAEVDRQADRESDHIHKITSILAEKKTVLLQLQRELDQANYQVTRMNAEAEYSAICEDFQMGSKSPRIQTARSDDSDAVSEFTLALDRLRNSK